MPEWTPQQRKVIDARNPEILVSAAAGSGKTAVLVERVASLIQEGFLINRMLIITFTHAAAAEMKEKIRNRLASERENPKFAQALESLESADISTIHSFCQHLIHSQFQAIGKDPDTGICDTALQKQLFQKAFRAAVDEVKSSPEPEMSLFMKAYRSDQAEEMVKSLYDFLMSLPEPFEWMIQKCENVPRETNPDHPWFRTIQRMAEEKIQRAEIHLMALYQMMEEEDSVPEYIKTLDEDAKTLETLKVIIRDPNRTSEKKSTVSYSKLVTVKNLSDYQKEWKEQFSNERKKIKGITDDILTILFPNMDKAGQEFATMAELLKGFRILTEATAKAYKKAKDEKFVEDFADLEHDALAILKQDTVRLSVQHEYDHIFVDECQDNSAVQDAILQLIHGEDNVLFMVGDVKQSIYRFRLADPTIFLNRMNRFSDDEKARQRRIFLQSNFRSRPEILETVNIVFRHTMKKESAELDYEAKEELYPGRKTEGFQPVLIDLIHNDREETELTDLEAIADHIVSRGTELLDERYEEKDRNYTWRDMVILMPKIAGDGIKLADALTARGVPVFFDGGREYFKQEEIIVLTDLLKLIDHPMQDIPLISVLRNTPFFLSDDELAEIRLCRTGKNVPYYEAFAACCETDTDLGKKCRAAKELLTEWRFLSETLPLTVFLWRILRESGHYVLTGAGENGLQQQANLRLLCAQASECEKSGIHTLHDFLNHMKDMSVSGETQSARLLGEKDDLVRIMTMHKSKGLQFPIVFCVGIDKPAKPKEDSALKTHNELGVCLHYKNVKLRIDRKTVADEIFAWQKNLDETAERIRLLYVAMTRAQEKLFMVSCKTEDPLWTYPECTARTLSSPCGIDWIMAALNDEEKFSTSTSYSQGVNPWKIRHFDANEQKNVEKEKVIHNLEPWLKSILSVSDGEPMWIKTDNPQSGEAMIKTSVTSLIRQIDPLIRSDEDPDENMEDKRTPAERADIIRLSEVPEYPAFMQESKKMTAAHRGTVVHHMLSLVDLDALREDPMLFETVRSEKKRMTEAHIFSEEEVKQIRESDIVRFFASEIGQRVLKSTHVRREWNFNLLIPEKQDLILQGMIDCAFEEEDGWVILDYKTDRITDEEKFTSEYAPQLAWYARAVETLTGKPVKEKWLYALSVGKGYQI